MALYLDLHTDSITADRASVLGCGVQEFRRLDEAIGTIASASAKSFRISDRVHTAALAIARVHSLTLDRFRRSLAGFPARRQCSRPAGSASHQILPGTGVRGVMNGPYCEATPISAAKSE